MPTPERYAVTGVKEPFPVKREPGPGRRDGLLIAVQQEHLLAPDLAADFMCTSWV